MTTFWTSTGLALLILAVGLLVRHHMQIGRALRRSEPPIAAPPEPAQRGAPPVLFVEPYEGPGVVDAIRVVAIEDGLACERRTNARDATGGEHWLRALETPDPNNPANGPPRRYVLGRFALFLVSADGAAIEGCGVHLRAALHEITPRASSPEPEPDEEDEEEEEDDGT